MDAKGAGLRARKNQARRRRIAEESLRLYVGQGYENTTLAAIAAASGISPRTLYLHFRTKEDTLKYWQEGFVNDLPGIMSSEAADQGPLQAARNSLLRLSAEQDLRQAATVDALLESNVTLAAHKQAMFLRLEQTMFGCLCRMWPAILNEELKTTAMVAVGALRLAMQTWRDEGARLPIYGYLIVEFARLETILQATDAGAGRTPCG